MKNITKVELKPYVGEGVTCQGVLIDIIPARKKSQHRPCLVFGSVQLVGKGEELDHLVVMVTDEWIEWNGLKMYNKYQFKGIVQSYWQTREVCGIPAKTKDWGLRDVMQYKVKELPKERKNQLSRFLNLRLEEMLRTGYTNSDVVYTRKRLLNMKEGTRERVVETLIRKKRSRSMNRYEREVALEMA